MIDLSIITVTYNSEKNIAALLDSIYKERTKLTLEVIVVDNQSADASVDVAKKHKIKSTVIRMATNAGFSAAVNHAISLATGEYYLFLNPDTVVLPGALKKLLDFARDTDPLGAVAPRLLNPDGQPQASVYKFPTITNAIKHYSIAELVSTNICPTTGSKKLKWRLWPPSWFPGQPSVTSAV